MSAIVISSELDQSTWERSFTDLEHTAKRHIDNVNSYARQQLRGIQEALGASNPTQALTQTAQLRRDAEQTAQSITRVKRAFAEVGVTAAGSSRIAREAFITASSEIIESWGVDGDIANEIGKMLAGLPTASLKSASLHRENPMTVFNSAPVSLPLFD